MTKYSTLAVGFLAVLAVAHSTFAAEAYSLAEKADDTRVVSVKTRMTVDGQLHTARGDGKATALPLKVEATLNFRERRLAGTGRDAVAFRALRHYDEAEAKIVVGGQASSARLRPGINPFVAQGRRAGVELYSLSTALTRGEIDLLDAAGDSLTISALLPPTKVEVGGKWSPDSWVAQTLTGCDAVLKSDLTCQLASVKNNVASMTFTGHVEGATDGASTKIEFSGSVRFDLKNQLIASVTLKQTEKRSVGPISPGTDVTATVTVERAVEKTPTVLADIIADRVPLDPQESHLLLAFRSPLGIGFQHDRGWHVFHQSGKLAILRLLDKGSLIAQCNISRIPDVKPGKHTSGQVFQQDIATALGKRLKEIVQAEQLETNDGRFLYRVTAVGEANGQPMHWIYYLCTAPSGKQVAFVFAAESKLLEKLAKRDLGIVLGLEFLKAGRPPVRTTTDSPK
jgi:hypothetical protein